MPTVYPAAIDTNAAGSLNASKVNKEPITNASEDVDAAELNTTAGAVLALEKKLGADPDGTLALYGDADEGNIQELMDVMVHRADRAGFHDHFVWSSTSLPANTVSNYVDQIAGGAAPAFATVAGGIGVSSQTSGVGAQCGLRGTDNHFHSRSTYYRCRFKLDTIAVGPWANGDQIDLGLWLDANNYVRLRSNVALGAMADYIYEIYDGGVGTNGTLTGSAPDTDWHVFEILTTSTGAYFFMDRGEAGELTSGLYTGTAPDNGQCRPYVAIEVAAGGPVLSVDAMSCQDTRTL